MLNLDSECTEYSHIPLAFLNHSRSSLKIIKLNEHDGSDARFLILGGESGDWRKHNNLKK